ncbi:MAG: CHAT domain-containing protein [Acidimicrobiia bacterium]
MIGVFSGAPGGGGVALPRTVHLWIARRPRTRGAGGVGLDVRVLREGAGIAWQRSAALSAADLSRLRDGVADLHRWSAGQGLTAAGARTTVDRLGRLLRSRVLGTQGAGLLADLDPTALLVGVDETLAAVPWELLTGVDGEGPAVTTTPMGRLVSSTARPRAGRDPRVESPAVRILVVAPAKDLAATRREVDQLTGLAGTRAGIEVEVSTLVGGRATLAGLRGRVRDREFDVLHLAGHGRFDEDMPSSAGFKLADTWLDGDALSDLPWAKPPAVVVNTSCTSARVAAGRGLVATRDRGLPAAALGAGCAAYLGFSWPVRDHTAATFAEAFYDTLVARWEAGLAVSEARAAVRVHFERATDLAVVGAVFYGDVATGSLGERPRPDFVAEAV